MTSVPPVGSRIQVGAADLVFVALAPYVIAHPGESCDRLERCPRCAIALRPDTGEIVLLWLAGEQEWTVSRADPEWERHRAQFAAGGVHA